MNSNDCRHQIVYFGVTNVNIDEKTIGSVDIWRCGICMKMFCEEKQLGIDSISDYVGMPNIEHDEKWAILVRRLFKGKERWRLVRVRQNGMIKVENPKNEINEIQIQNFMAQEREYDIHLIESNVNCSVEI